MDRGIVILEEITPNRIEIFHPRTTVITHNFRVICSDLPLREVSNKPEKASRNIPVLPDPLTVLQFPFNSSPIYKLN